jgi:hypothetical protein
MAEPCLRHEVRGSHRRRRRSVPLPLTLSLSPLKRGEGTLQLALDIT